MKRFSPATLFVLSLIIAAVIGTYGSNPQAGGYVILAGIVLAFIAGRARRGSASARGGAGASGQQRYRPKGQKCRYVKTWTGERPPHFPYCACMSPGRAGKGKYGTTREGYPIMGSVDHYGPDQWYKLCVHGRDENDHGVTPSKCRHYRS